MTKTIASKTVEPVQGDSIRNNRIAGRPTFEALITAAGTQSKREIWPDLVRVYATVMVVLLHAASLPVSRFAIPNLEGWIWADIYRSITSTCIPLFVMLSGALLLNAPSWDASSFFRRRFHKIIIPLVVWSAVYALWSRHFHGQSITLTHFLAQLVAGISNPPYVHLWFLYLILSLYLMVPIFRVYVLNASEKNQFYFAGLWFTATAVIPILSAGGLSVDLYLAPVAGFIGYFVLGASVARFLTGTLPRSALILAAVASIGGMVFTAWATYIISVRDGTLYENLYSHTAPNVVLMSVPTFLILRHVGTLLQQRAVSGVARALSIGGALSFGVYLAHVLVMEVLESGILGVSLGRARFPASFGVPAVASVILLLTSLIVAVLRRSPLRGIVP